MINDPYTESIPAFALGCLEKAEQAELERHLAACPDCQAELRAYQSLTEDLALSVPVREPPARLKQAILQKTVPAAPLMAKKVSGNWWQRAFGALQPAWGALSLVIILALASTSLVLWQQVQNAPKVQNTFHVIPMKAPDTSQQATALLVIDNVGHYGSLVTDKLKPLASDQQYQLWLIKDGVRTNGGVFSVNLSGYGWLKVESKISLLEYQSFGVTIEPKGGSPGPTGPKVLGGNF